MKLSAKLERDAQTLAWYINGEDLESALESATYNHMADGFQPGGMESVNVIRRAIQINEGD